MKRVLSAFCCGTKPRPPPVQESKKRLEPVRRSSTVGMTTGAAVPTEPGAKQKNRPLHEYRFPRTREYEDEANLSA